MWKKTNYVSTTNITIRVWEKTKIKMTTIQNWEKNKLLDAGCHSKPEKYKTDNGPGKKTLQIETYFLYFEFLEFVENTWIQKTNSCM